MRAYYRNLAVWGTRADRIRCMNSRLALDVIFDGNVFEAVLTTSNPDLEDMTPLALKLVGVHARDALGRRASQCQSFQLVLDLVLQRAMPDLVPDVDPWRPGREERPDSNWVDASALLDVLLGGALVALRAHVGEPTLDTAELDDEEAVEVMARGGERAAELALRSLGEELEEARQRLQR
ncbi:hypothetical protein [Blastococcus colisei]|uniref:hypothetical protein n=1 Tax=Blastococcus colisei TaxID=1564162 RepID=UPI00114F408F|nr:hypothetical protein [Blastococcus colisei]